MAGTVTESTDQDVTANPADTVDVDAMLAEADSLAANAAAAMVEEPKPSPESSTDASAAESAPKPESTDRAAAPPSGLGSTLDDLDNLLEELGEKPQAAAEEPAPEAVASPAETEAGDSAPESPPAGGSENPYASEVAKMEQEWAAAAKAGGVPEAISATMSAGAKSAAAGPAGDAIDEPVRSLPVRILHRVAAPVVGLLAIVDIPFARLSPRLKGVLGYAALATLAIAVTVWFAGPSLIHLPIFASAAPSASAEEAPAPENAHGSAKKASHSGSHSSAKDAKASDEGSHSSAKESKSAGEGSHSSAKKSKPEGEGSHSSAKESKPAGEGSHSSAKESKPTGEGSHSSGKASKASGSSSHSSSKGEKSSGGGSHSSAKESKGSGEAKHEPAKKSH